VLLLSTVYSWLPEELNLLDGMTLGAGLGAAAGGLLGLILKIRDDGIEIENFVVVGTVAGVVSGAVFVAAGNLKII
jgi:hypothetical protein